jgi:FkbM family methyltransferase
MLTLRGVLRLLTAPYLLQPLQVLRRLRLECRWQARTEATVMLPWGLPLTIDPHEAIGYNIACQGVYEMSVTEALWRLTDPDDLAVDAGANIGYTASVLGARVGRQGRVMCFEPHPAVFESLRRNVARWDGKFILRQAALGASNGTARLRTSDWFQTNRGTAWVGEGDGIDVPLFRLDTLIDEPIGIVKIDVEGYELEVLRGMTRLLSAGAVRDIIFEERAPYPASTHEMLRECGYTVLGLREGWMSVRTIDRADTGPNPTYLATRDPGRVLRRLKGMWRSFGIFRR